MNIKKSLTLLLLLFLPFLTVQANEMNETSDFTLSKIQVVPIKDTQADRQYELYIKLPESYTNNKEKDKDKHYPVIYFTDALWHIELLSGAAEYLMEDAILVGISWQKDINKDLKKDVGEYVSRFRDYSVIESNKPERQAKYQFGQANNHLDFIRNDVITMIEKNYRTDPERRTYFGYSAGGVFGAYILMAQPDTFKNYILGSPALKGDMPFLSKLGSNAALKVKDLNTNVFITYGSLEKEASKHIEEFITLLKNKNDKSLSLKHPVIEGNHQSAFPLTGVRGITWLSNLTRVKD
jgi:predicted alpha/beta superfamily hydrolase